MVKFSSATTDFGFFWEVAFWMLDCLTAYCSSCSEIYGEAQVLEVQLAYNFRKLKDAQRKVIAAQMGRHHCEELLQKTGERPLTTISTNKLSPCQCCGASHVDGIEYFTEEEEDGKMEVDQQRQKLKSLGMAFVTFENAKVVQRLEESLQFDRFVSPLIVLFCLFWLLRLFVPTYFIPASGFPVV